MIYQYNEEIQFELDQLRSVTSSDFSGMAWIEHHDSRIRWLYASGNSNERYKKLALKPGRGLAGLVIKLGRHVIVDAAMQNLERLRHDYSIMLVEQLLSAIAVPITIRYETCGVLLIGDRTERLYETSDLYPIIHSADLLALLFQQIKYGELKK
jgi:nitrogen regulatory protein A